jgi:hypothetical protein
MRAIKQGNAGTNQPYLLRLHACSEDAEAQSSYFIVALQLIPRCFASGLASILLLSVGDIASAVTSKPAASLAKQQQHNHNQKGLPNEP